MRGCQTRLSTIDADPVRPRKASFFRNEDGSLIIFSLMMFVLMLIIAGMSLDIERFETARTKLQATADAAALAAASLTQEETPQNIVDDFFEKAEMDRFLEDVHVVSALNSNVVTVEADVNVPTHFFNMLGMHNLGTQVESIAAEAVGDVEISLVLDVSGSMYWDSKLENLKDAAEDFLDSIYAASAAGSVSVSIVPYSTQVSAGDGILDYFTDREESHEHSHCLNFDSGDFDTITLDPASNVEQALHFDPYTDEHDSFSATHDLWYQVCPDDSWKDIMVFSEDTTALKNYVNAFQATNWTSIELGMKWGAALLDPAFQPVISGMVASGDVSSNFDGRPLSFEEGEGLKVIVVMTDGENTEHYEMEDPYRSGDSFVWVYFDNNDRPYYSIWGGSGEPTTEVQYETVTESESVCVDWRYVYSSKRKRWRWKCYDYEEYTWTTTQPVYNWYLANDYSSDGVSDGWRTTPFGGEDATLLTWDQLWALVPVEYFTDEYLKDMGYSSSVRNAIEDARNYVGQSTKDSRTLQICSAAKNAGIWVYAIGFDAPYDSELLLESCATSASHFFDVEGTEISQAFSAIAADISRLRLLQ